MGIVVSICVICMT